MVLNGARRWLVVFPKYCRAARLVRFSSNFPVGRPRLLAKLLVEIARSLPNSVDKPPLSGH
jgi:hypothetical protein